MEEVVELQGRLDYLTPALADKVLLVLHIFFLVQVIVINLSFSKSFIIYYLAIIIFKMIYINDRNHTWQKWKLKKMSWLIN